MDDRAQTSPAPPAGTTSRWASVAVLGVVLMALGSALYFVLTQKEELRAANTLTEASLPEEKKSASADATESAIVPTRVNLNK